MDKLDTFETIRDGDFIFRMPKDEVPVLREYIVALAHKALDEYAKRYQFTSQGHDSHRGVRQARRLRRPQRGAARDGRRPRRLLRPRRDDGLAEGAAAGIVPMGGDALARTGPRHHDRHVEPADSAVADRRASRRSRRSAPGRNGRAGRMWNSRRCSSRGETIKLRELNAAFTNPRTISLAYFEAALLVEHLGRSTATAAWPSWCARTPRGSTPTPR